MKTRQAAIKDILDSLRLDSVEESVSILTDVYRQRAEIIGESVHFTEEDLTISFGGYQALMTRAVTEANTEELRENFSLLTGVRHEWVMISEESDCQPEWVLKPLEENKI